MVCTSSSSSESSSSDSSGSDWDSDISPNEKEFGQTTQPVEKSGEEGKEKSVFDKKTDSKIRLQGIHS